MKVPTTIKELASEFMSFKDEILAKHDELLQALNAKTELVNRLETKASVLEE